MKLSTCYYDTILLFAAGMKGILPTEEKEYSSEDVAKIEKTARMQGVWPVVFAVLKKLSERGKVNVPATTMAKWQMELNLKVMEYTLRQEAMYAFLEKELSFANPVMLKGDLMSDLYANPELRFSGDTDLLIHPKDEKAVLDAFRKAGGEYQPRGENNNQAVCVHPKAGKFEVHIALDTREVTEVWYNNLDFGAEEKRNVTLRNGHTVLALGVTDGAINMVLHFLKHLISGISHLKMLGDSLLYLSHYASQIDFARVDFVMQQLGYTEIYETMKRIGSRYFGFSNLSSKEEYDTLSDKVLLDLQYCAEAGYEEEILSAYTEYSKKRYEAYHKKNYGDYKSKLQRREVWERLFPQKTLLYKEYPVLVKHGWLLMFVWIVRIWKKIFGKKETVSKKTQPRMDLLKELKLL